MTDPIWLERVLEWYGNNTDALLGEILLTQVSLSELQDHWDAAHDNPMVELFQVTEKQRLFMEQQVGFQLDFSRFEYYLTAYSTDLATQKESSGFMGLYAPPRVLAAFPTAIRVAPRKSVE